MIKPKKLYIFNIKEYEILIFQLTYNCSFFEHTILPIDLYRCEIWAYENTNIIEKLQK